MNTVLESWNNICLTCGTAALLLLAIPAQAQSIDKALEGARETVKEASAGPIPHDGSQI